MNNKSKNLDELLDIVEESKEVLARANELSERLEHLRNHTSIGETVHFNSHQNYFFEPTIDNIKSLISLKTQIDDLKSAPDIERDEYEIGDILMALHNVRLSRVEQHHPRRIDVNGTLYDRFYANDYVIILDITGSTYTLISSKSKRANLIYATKTQLQTLFEHTGKKHKEGYHKISFNVNGMHEKYLEKLDFIYLYERTSRYDMDEFYQFKNQCLESSLIDIKHDEAFGTIGVAFFKGDVKPNYQEISLFFSSKFAVMFTQDSNDKEIYKYNSKRSKFSKDSGKDGTHYYPKDVFNMKGTKGRVLNLLETVTMFEDTVEEESRV